MWQTTTNVPACLADNFYGIFGQRSLFKLSDVACLVLVPASSDGGSFIPLYSHQQHLVWIQESSVDDSLCTLEYEYEVAQFLCQFHGAHESISTGPQTTFLDHSVSLIHRSDHFVILAVPDERAGRCPDRVSSSFLESSSDPRIAGVVPPRLRNRCETRS